MGKKIGMLCNDCLREILTTNDELLDSDWMNWGGNFLCPCGGDVCGCPSCAATLQSLKNGSRDSAALGLSNIQDGFKWSPAKGVGA